MTTSNQQTVAKSNSNFGGLLFLAFLVLKLTHVIGWSWWWVTAPLWIGWAFIGAICLLGLIVALAVAVFAR